jgi:hypothetical protein
MSSRVENSSLLAAGLESMATAGKPLAKVNTGTRSMMYRMSDGGSVRVRTCNDHILVVIATASNNRPTLNIEGTDYLLFVVPQVERTKGAIEAYLLPTLEVSRSVRSAYADTLSKIDGIHNHSTTCNLWLADGEGAAFGFRSRWAAFRLTGASASITTSRTAPAKPASPPTTLGDAIEAAKEQIARAAGVPLDRVKITVEVLF